MSIIGEQQTKIMKQVSNIENTVKFMTNDIKKMIKLRKVIWILALVMTVGIVIVLLFKRYKGKKVK